MTHLLNQDVRLKLHTCAHVYVHVYVHVVIC